jgi:hypothetical protein
MVVAAVSPIHAWQQPILRLIDTVVGTAIALHQQFNLLDRIIASMHTKPKARAPSCLE